MKPPMAWKIRIPQGLCPRMGELERWNRILHGCCKLNRQISLLKAHTRIRPSFGTGRGPYTCYTADWTSSEYLRAMACSTTRTVISSISAAPLAWNTCFRTAVHWSMNSCIIVSPNARGRTSLVAVAMSRSTLCFQRSMSSYLRTRTSVGGVEVLSRSVIAVICRQLVVSRLYSCI